MKRINYIILPLLLILFYQCDKKPEFDREMNQEIVSKYSNENTNGEHTDSLAFLQTIASQKIQEVYDLASSLHPENDKLKDTLLLNQLKNYFVPNDTLNIFKMRKELDSLSVYYVRLSSNLELINFSEESIDSTYFFNYALHYFNKDKEYISTVSKKGSFILSLSDSLNIEKNFKFYFTGLDIKENDSLGVTQ